MKKTDSPPSRSSSSVLRPHGGDRAGHLCNSQGGCSTAVPPAPAYSRVSRCIFPPPLSSICYIPNHTILTPSSNTDFYDHYFPPLNETQNPLRKSQTDFRLSAGGWGCTERGQNCSLLPNPTRMQYWRIHLCSLQGASDLPLQITVLPMSCPNHYSNTSKRGYHVLNLVLQYIFSLFSFFN